jgi:hypothetical protein
MALAFFCGYVLPMPKPRRAQKIRNASEFAAGARAARARPNDPAVFAWTVSQIIAARDAQSRGDLRHASRLASAMLTDDAIFVAFNTRVEPQRSIAVAVKPANDKAKAVSIAAEAEALYGRDGIGFTMPTALNVVGDLVNHGVAFGHVDKQLRDDGERVDLYVSHWPAEHVRWDELKRAYFTYAEFDGSAAFAEIEVKHGDGEWIIFASRDTAPWKYGAIRPAAAIWARHAYAGNDWARGSTAHGNAKVVGELPEGQPLQDGEGALTPEAAAFLELVRAVADGDSPCGIRPFGSKLDYLTNGSSAWQVWKELVGESAKAAARIYLGTDGILGAQGGAPGVDITELMGVAATLVIGDLETIERCFHTGVMEPWCAINFGDSSLAPRREYQIPRAEDEAAVEALAKREQAFFAAVESARRAGFEMSQEWVDALAERYHVTSPPLPQAASKAPTIALAPTDVVEWITPNEVRAASGLGPQLLADGSPDPNGFIQIKQIRAAEDRAKAVALSSQSVAGS